MRGRPAATPRNQDRAIVVTGASTGIGAACVLHLDHLGFRVFAGVRTPEDGDALEQRASERLTALSLDVTDERSVLSAQARVRALVGDPGVSGLVNNAGIVVAGPLEIVPIAELRRQFDVNVIGVAAVTQAFLPLLRQGRGRIVNMGSIAGLAAMPMMGPYAASKHALEAMTDALRLELRQWGIHVSIVEPGSIATPVWEKSTKDLAALKAATPPELIGLYGKSAAGIRAVFARAAVRAAPVEIVARAVEHALTAAHPRTRYLIGADARTMALMARFLPDRLFDRLLARVFRLPRWPS